MTQKELLYIEDAIGHEKNIILLLTNNIDFIKDKSIIDFYSNEIKLHKEILKTLFNQLEVLVNE